MEAECHFFLPILACLWNDWSLKQGTHWREYAQVHSFQITAGKSSWCGAWCGASKMGNFMRDFMED